MDSRLYGTSHNSLFLVDSRFRGNDGNGQPEHTYSLDIPSATAGTDPLAVASLRGNDGNHFPSFPRKRESTRTKVAGGLPCERDSASLPRAARGLTLIEMLVVLVLVSLLGTLLIQGAGFFLGQYAAVQRVHREASREELRRHWFVSTLQAMVPSKVETRRFAGDASSFEGVTLQALAGEPGRPLRVRWSIDAGGASPAVVYAEEDAAPWTVLRADDEALAFQYADSTRQWHERWPVTGDTLERIPRMVRLVSGSGRTLWLARLDLFPEPVPNYREEF